jgi:hypothetical protein
MRQRNFRRSSLGLLALLVLVFSLALVGCDDDGGGGGDNDAEPQDLENQTFTFQNANGFFGIPAGTAFTLAFGDFGGDNTAPFTLNAAGNTAIGQVTVSSCLFEFADSNFPAGQGPDDDDVVDTDCTIENGDLRLGGDDTGTTGSSGDT